MPMNFTQEELERQVNDTRKEKTLRSRRPEERIAGKELAKIVAKRTGYQVKATTEIIDAYHLTIFELLKKKVQVMLPFVGTLVPKVTKARRGMNFNRGTNKPPEKIIMQPKFSLGFIVNKNMVVEMKNIPVTHDDIENLYITE